MGSLSNDNVVDAGDSVENDCTVSTIDIVQGRVSNGAGNGETEAQLSDSGENLCHGSVTGFTLRFFLLNFNGKNGTIVAIKFTFEGS